MLRKIELRRNLPRVARGVTVLARDTDREHVCILADASDGGAGLRINPNYPLPKRFTLVLANVEVPVVVKWRKKDRTGVRFGFSPSQSPEAHRQLLGGGGEAIESSGGD